MCKLVSANLYSFVESEAVPAEYLFSCFKTPDDWLVVLGLQPTLPKGCLANRRRLGTVIRLSMFVLCPSRTACPDLLSSNNLVSSNTLSAHSLSERTRTEERKDFYRSQSKWRKKCALWTVVLQTL
jgi:hypothetical protein